MEWSMIVWHVLASIGLAKILYDFLPFLYWVLFCKINLDEFRYGYVMITGATDGIGKSISKEFIKRGFKVLLVSRSLEKLQRVKTEFIAEYPEARIDVIAADFSESHKFPVTFYSALLDQLKAFPISILINNVGSASVKMLHTESWSNIETMLGVNIYPSTHLTHGLMPIFLTRFKETKQRSLVITMSSLMEESYFPANAVYSATKRYNSFMSEGLKYEFSGKVLFATIKPGLVKTNMTEANRTSDLPMSTDSDTYVKGMIGGLREGVNHGYWKHKVIGFVLNSAPYLVTVAVVRMVIGRAVKKQIIS